MNDAELRVTYAPDDEWHGELYATVKSGEFSGHGSAWFGKARIKDTFVSALRGYPLSPTNLPILEGGFWQPDKKDTLSQCHLRVAVSPKDSRGTLLVRVELAMPTWTSPDEDTQQTVTARFFTGYNALERFSLELEEVLDGGRVTAILLGSSS